ncbi:unnamed protein product [Larinioides sclopetarius]
MNFPQEEKAIYRLNNEVIGKSQVKAKFSTNKGAESEAASTESEEGENLIADSQITMPSPNVPVIMDPLQDKESKLNESHSSEQAPTSNRKREE